MSNPTNQQSFQLDSSIASPEEVDAWFKDEISSWFISHLKLIAEVVRTAEEDIDQMVVSGLEDTFIERSIRDIKAVSFDAINKMLLDMI